MEINSRGREKNRNTYKKRRGGGEEEDSVSERERERWNKQCGGKIHRMIKTKKRISFLQTPFVLLQKGTPLFQKQKEGFKFLYHVKFLIHPLLHFYPLCLLTNSPPNRP